MHRILYFAVIAVLVSGLVAFGCSSSGNYSSTAKSSQNTQDADNEQGQGDESPQDPFFTNGLTVVDQVTIGGDNGRLALDKNQKTCIVLQGSAYNMGYQMGYLMPEATSRLTSEFTRGVMADFIGLEGEEIPDVLYQFIINEVSILCNQALDVIPDNLEKEMRGIAQGTAARGYEVSFEDVLLLNEGIDALFSIFMSRTLPNIDRLSDVLEGLYQEWPQAREYIRLEGGEVLFPRANPYFMGCNEFVVSKTATVGDHVFHGRDFMFPTGDIYQDYACMGVYLPDEGYPFITATAPGFVGQATAVNSKGLSMGMDVVMGECTRSTPGLGCLLVLRDIVQNCSNLDEAVERMKAQDRGVSWIYVLADDEWSETYTNGIVVEEGMSEDENGQEFSGPDLLPLWEQWLLKPYIDRLDPQIVPDRGLMFRNQEWIYPREFWNINTNLTWGDDSKRFRIYFPDQIETWPDVVIATNNYIIPRMVLTTFSPWILLIRDVTERVWRYETLFDHIAPVYQDIDFNTARDLIDFLNPNQDIDYEYYEPGGQIEGHHAIIDNGELIMEALFGYYGPDAKHMTPWARIDLKPFLENVE